jgi:hypothetical protein
MHTQTNGKMDRKIKKDTGGETGQPMNALTKRQMDISWH